jgi:lipopolysaccharide biosynthesis protein
LWWGAGFTEWNNVVKGRARFKGHYQPHLPSELGFYDLRLAEVREMQVKLAASHRINGFCYYHYWFNGKVLLERPIKEILKNKKLDFPFCMCWANENWTRAWDGLDNEILIQQKYTYEDSLKHIKYLIKYFKDSRYIKIDECPLFLIYRVENIPNIARLLDLWKKVAKDNGIKDIFFSGVTNGFSGLNEKDILNLGFNAVVNFQPNRENFPKRKANFKTNFYEFLRKALPNQLYQYLKRNLSAIKIINYNDMVEDIIANWNKNGATFPCVFPSWDNSARRSTPTIIQNTNPKKYGYWLENAIRMVRNNDDDKKIVFINAWNEWAEGCHLEPDQKFGRAFLLETKKVVEKIGN